MERYIYFKLRKYGVIPVRSTRMEDLMINCLGVNNIK